MLGQNEFQKHNQDDGFILRRIDIAYGQCSLQSAQKPASVVNLDFFIRNIEQKSKPFLTTLLDLFKPKKVDCNPDSDNDFVYGRFATATCGQAVGTGFGIGGYFGGGLQYKLTCLAHDG